MKKWQILIMAGLILFVGCAGKENKIEVNKLEENTFVQMQVPKKLINTTDSQREESFGEVGRVITALKNKEKNVREEAIWRLGKTKDSRAIIPLTALLKEEEGDVQEWIIGALCEIKDSCGTETFIATLKNKNEDIQETVEILSEIEDEEAEELLAILKDSNMDREEIVKNPLQEAKIKTIESIKLKNGITEIDLNDDKRTDMVIKGYRGNISAHSFSVYSFYILQDQRWNIVARQDSSDVSQDSYVTYTHEGAEELLRDIRLVKLKNSKSYYLVIGERPTGISYASKEEVTFIFYKLFYIPDEKRFVYKKVKTMKGGNKYCDVDEAFMKELKYN